MRIAYVINSLEGGGACAPIPGVARLFQANGHDVRIWALTLKDGRGLPTLRDAGLAVEICEGGEKDHLAAIRWLDRKVVEWQPDILWTSLTRATLLGQIVGQMHDIDVVSWQHNAYLKPANTMLLRARRRRSILWVADSNCVAELTRRRLGIDPRHVATWPLFSADASAPQAAPWRPGEPLRIGSLGRLHRAKGYDMLIAALAMLRAGGFVPPVPLDIAIAGEGSQRAELEAAAAAAKIDELRFVGFSEAQSFLAGRHLYLQPSRAEGLCIAAHEAMQAALPVLGSAVGEMPHTILPGRTGQIVPPADPRALADAWRSMLREPAALASMGAAARARVLDLFGGGAFERAGSAALAEISRIRAHRASA
ncbi:MAG TPA: glycosyltransferase family 4 protein [Sphingomonas sp.]|nr:glycosyltransferase family 4 protein [Sphingomonas sp.]